MGFFVDLADAYVVRRTYQDTAVGGIVPRLASRTALAPADAFQFGVDEYVLRRVHLRYWRRRGFDRGYEGGEVQRDSRENRRDDPDGFHRKSRYQCGFSVRITRSRIYRNRSDPLPADGSPDAEDRKAGPDGVHSCLLVGVLEIPTNCAPEDCYQRHGVG